MDKLTEYREEVMNPKGGGLKFEIACIEDCIKERKKLGKDCEFEERLLKSYKREAKKRGIQLVTSGGRKSSGIKAWRIAGEG